MWGPLSVFRLNQSAATDTIRSGKPEEAERGVAELVELWGKG